MNKPSTTATVVEEDVAVISENPIHSKLNLKSHNEKTAEAEYKYAGVSFKAPLHWTNIIGLSIFHALAVWGFFVYVLEGKLVTTIWSFLLGGIGGFGTTAGVHRLWCHRAYKAKLPLRIFLAFCFSVAGQNTIFDWVRDHRVHHKYSETDADPHNSRRGFFFAHIGWLMMRKHPDVLRKGQTIDMSDVRDDPVVIFHHKYFVPLKLMFCFVLPTLVPVYFWGETWYMAMVSQALCRYSLGLNFTWSVNSAAHLWGSKPYDKRISPVENIGVAIVAMGEGWHNYHHVFPWDYKAAELGNYTFNVTTMFIDMFAKMGWAYDLKQPSRELIKKVVENNGDGSHELWGQNEVPPPEDSGCEDCKQD